MKNCLNHIGNLNATPGRVAEPAAVLNAAAAADSCASLSSLLAAALQPAGIYRVEHRATDSGCTKTYTSLIILMADSDCRPLSRHEPLLQLAQLAPGHIQCFIHRLHTVKVWIRNGHPFYGRYLVDENLVFGSSEDMFPEPGFPLPPEILNGHRQTFSAYLEKAADFYDSALLLRRERGDASPLAVFMLHQAVELGFRGILEALNGYCRKTHEIRQLRELCFRCAPLLAEVFPDDTETERLLLDLLQEAYSGARYSSSFAVSAEQLDVLRSRTDQFLRLAHRVFLREFGPG